MLDVDSAAEKLAAVYAEPALVPPSRWLDKTGPSKPRARFVRDTATGEATMRFAPAEDERIWRWVIQSRVRGEWRTLILPGTERSHILKDDEADADLVSVTAVDRTGNVSAITLVRRAH